MRTQKLKWIEDTPPTWRGIGGGACTVSTAGVLKKSLHERGGAVLDVSGKCRIERGHKPGGGYRLFSFQDRYPLTTQSKQITSQLARTFIGLYVQQPKRKWGDHREGESFLKGKCDCL